jgi:tetratricopeptide (TPR) repeat protein
MTAAGSPEAQIGAGPPLRSWKEIAAFFGKDERTVKRWEARRGMPVHRLPGQTRATVYAYPSELQEWLTGARMPPAGVPASADDEIEPELEPGGTQPRLGLPARRRALVAGLGLAAAASLFVVVGMMPGEPPRQAERLSADATARDLYLSGTYQLGLRTADGFNRAIQLFTQAITRDPNFAAAYAGLSKAYNLISQYTSFPAARAFPLAESAARRALEIDPQLASAYASLAFTTFYWSRDFDRSRSLFETALSLDPDSAEANHWYGLTMSQVGEADIALKAITRAQQLDPGARAILANKALVLYHAGRLDEAASLLRDFIQTVPDYAAPHFYLADVYFDQGRPLDFLAESREAARIVNDDRMAKVTQAGTRGFADGGREGMLAAMLAEQRRQFEAGGYPAYKIARTLAQIGETDQALDYLAQAVASRENDTLGIRIDSAFRQLAGEPRFRDLVVEAGHKPPSADVPLAVAADAFRPETEGLR